VSAPRNTLGTLLQERRSQQGYSRARVAEAVGISPGTIEGWEIGRVVKPPLTDVLRLARFLSIPLEEIEQAALADDDETGREHERKQSDSGAARKLPGTTPLLEEAIRVMGWSEKEAADFLQTTPEQIAAWRRRSTALPIADVLALTSVVGARLSAELRGIAAESANSRA
jgi:transcriptional regulator with XRE-family HTH domain